MKYITPESYKYIINKYHDTKKPFDPHKRFLRQDELFSPESGADPDYILENIRKNDEQYSHLPHVIRKARALEFILKNTKNRRMKDAKSRRNHFWRTEQYARGE